MPSFSVSEYVDVEVDVDIDEFLDECSTDEIDEVLEWLRGNGHIKPEDILGDLSFDEQQLHNHLHTIQDSYYLLSENDMETIKKIANKL